MTLQYKVRECDLPIFFIFQDCLGYLCFHTNFSGVCPNYLNNVIKIFIEIALYLYSLWDRIEHLTILLLPIYE